MQMLEAIGYLCDWTMGWDCHVIGLINEKEGGRHCQAGHGGDPRSVWVGLTCHTSWLSHAHEDMLAPFKDMSAPS